MNGTPFWLVWCENGGEPRVKHDSKWKAENEATRLANLHPGKTFCVLPCAAKFSVNRVQIERFETDAPF